MRFFFPFVGMPANRLSFCSWLIHSLRPVMGRAIFQAPKLPNAATS